MVALSVIARKTLWNALISLYRPITQQYYLNIIIHIEKIAHVSIRYVVDTQEYIYPYDRDKIQIVGRNINFLLPVRVFIS